MITKNFDDLVDLLSMGEQELKDTLRTSPDVLVIDLRQITTRLKDLEESVKGKGE